MLPPMRGEGLRLDVVGGSELAEPGEDIAARVHWQRGAGKHVEADARSSRPRSGVGGVDGRGDQRGGRRSTPRPRWA